MEQSPTEIPRESSRTETRPEVRIELYDVMIAGVPLRLRTAQSEDAVKSLVTLVDSKIQEALIATKSASIQNAAILAALNLAEELLRLKDEAHSQLGRLEALTDSAIKDLEASRIS